MTTFKDVFGYFSLSTDSMTKIVGVSTFENPKPNTLAFLSRNTENAERTVDEYDSTLFLIPESLCFKRANTIAVENPRLAFAQLLRYVLQGVHRPSSGVASTAIIEDGAVVAEDAAIGHFVVVESGAVIGANSSIDHHSVVRAGVVIGKDCRVGSQVSLGGAGFGYEIDPGGTPIHIHHVGGLIIRDRVEIGSNVSIAQGTIEPTLIEDDVKIDDNVFIAHNVHVGRGTFLIAGAEVSGSVTIGHHAWISPEASILNQVTIGNGALVGLGAVVLRDVPDNEIVAGVPARSRGSRRHAR